MLAHRGASAYAPQHTLTAIGLALEQGADIIEVDTHVTRDGHAVLHHSGELSETTDGRGSIHRFNLAELSRFDAGYLWSGDGGQTYPYRAKGERIPTLADALATFPKARFNIDIKDRRAARAVRRVIDEHDAAYRVLLASWFSWRRAPALRDYPGPRSVTMDRMLAFLAPFWVGIDALWWPRVDAFQLPERRFGLRLVSPRLISHAHRKGIRVHVWTIDREADMDRLLDWGVDGIVTKRPDVAVRARARYLGRRSSS